MDISLLRKVIEDLVRTEFSAFAGECCFCLVTKRRMAALNRKFLNHEGAADVLAFDLAEDPKRILQMAEVYICPAVAREQAKEFRTSWPDELVCYHVHALLHLQGEDDKTPASRRIMKRREEHIMRSVRNRFSLDALEKKATLPAGGYSSGKAKQ